MSRSLLAALLCLASGLAGYALGAWSGSTEPTPPLADEKASPGERALELAEVRRVTLRLSADDGVQAQLPEADVLLRNRLAAAGLTVVEPGAASDATLVARLESHHFRAFDIHGVAAELHLEAPHEVRLRGRLRLIPHDLWQANTTRLVQPESLPRESLQALDELAVHLAGALHRARSAPR